MSEFMLGCSGSMDIARFLRYIYPRAREEFCPEIMDELILLSKMVITNLMEDQDAEPSEWRFDGTMLQGKLQSTIDVYDFWDTYKGLMIMALNQELEEEDKLQIEVNKICLNR